MLNLNDLIHKLLRHRFLLSLLLVVMLFAFLRGFIFEAYCIKDDSMEPNFNVGDYILVNKFIFGSRIPFTDLRLFPLRNVRRGDVIVFEYPDDPSKVFVRRVVALPGDIVEIRDKAVYINTSRFDVAGVQYREQTVIPLEQNPRDNRAPAVVPPNAYFVLGDNRDYSYDSRFWGFLSDNRVKGLVSFNYWSSRTEMTQSHDKQK